MAIRFPVCGNCVGAAMLTCSHEDQGIPVLIRQDDAEKLRQGVRAFIKLTDDGRLVVTACPYNLCGDPTKPRSRTHRCIYCQEADPA